MKKFIKSFFAIFVLVVLMQCGGSSKILFKKEAGFNPNTGKVLTMSVFDAKQNKVPDDDKALDAFGKIVAKKIGDMYGSLIPGGPLVDKAAEELNIKDKIDKVTKDLTSAYMKNGGVKIGTPLQQEALNMIAEKMGVDALAFPVSYGGTNDLKNSQKIQLAVIVYDVRSNQIQYWGKTEKNSISISSLVLAGIKDDEDKIKAAAVSTVTGAANDLMGKIMSEVSK